MTVGDLKKLIESGQVTDDFEIDVVGEHSGSFSGILRVAKRIEPFEDGDYKEFQLFINA